MYFWLNYCGKNHHIKRILIVLENVGHLFHLASEIIKADRLHLFLLSGGTRINEDEYLSSLENGTKLIVCMEEQIEKLPIYFEIKRYLSLKNVSYLLNIDYFIWRLTAFQIAAFFKITLMFILAVLGSTSSLVQSVFMVFTYAFEQARHIQ